MHCNVHLFKMCQGFLFLHLLYRDTFSPLVHFFMGLISLMVVRTEHTYLLSLTKLHQYKPGLIIFGYSCLCD